MTLLGVTASTGWLLLCLLGGCYLRLSPDLDKEPRPLASMDMTLNKLHGLNEHRS
jgi:hypothetical protein